jgi:Ca2+-binding RTX toxin-like protein
MSPLFEGTNAGETITGSPGDDTIIAGTGDDRLEGKAGSDTYIWNPNDGMDVIRDNSGTNILKIGSGISPSGVTFTRGGDNNNDAVFIMPDGGRVTVERWFYASSYRLSEVQFSDGTIWTKAQITSMSAQLEGSDEGETISGTSGSDTIDGGTGDDRLEGAGGNDTYVWDLGDGNDVIYDNAGTNILQIGEGVIPSDVTLTRTGTGYRDAVFIMPSGERITVERWFSGSLYQLSEIQFSNGSVWTRAYVNALDVLLEGTDENDTIDGTSGNDIIYGYDGDDSITASGGNDTMTGGAGDDFLNGETGDDTYTWSLGDGNDAIHDYYGTNFLHIEGADPEDVKFTRSGTSFRDAVFIMPQDERITVESWFSASAYQIDEIQFADGTVWTKAAVNGFSPVMEGTDGNETIQGSPSGDTMICGLGNDRLEGGLGGDIYTWNPGDSHDTIYDISGTNALEIGEGIDPTDLSLTRSGNNLVIQFGENSSDSVTIDRWYLGSLYQLSAIRFADGTAWPRADVTAIAAGTKQPYSTSSGQGRGESLSSYENGPKWKGAASDETEESETPGSGGGCDTGVFGLTVLAAAVASRLLKKRSGMKL